MEQDYRPLEKEVYSLEQKYKKDGSLENVDNFRLIFLSNELDAIFYDISKQAERCYPGWDKRVH